MENSEQPPKAWTKRIVWFFTIWAVSVLALASVSYGLKFFFDHIYN